MTNQIHRYLCSGLRVIVCIFLSCYVYIRSAPAPRPPPTSASPSPGQRAHLEGEESLWLLLSHARPHERDNMLVIYPLQHIQFNLSASGKGQEQQRKAHHQKYISSHLVSRCAHANTYKRKHNVKTRDWNVPGVSFRFHRYTPFRVHGGTL